MGSAAAVPGRMLGELWTSIRVFHVSQFCIAMSQLAQQAHVEHAGEADAEQVCNALAPTHRANVLEHSSALVIEAAITRANDSTGADASRRFLPPGRRRPCAGSRSVRPSR